MMGLVDAEKVVEIGWQFPVLLQLPDIAVERVLLQCDLQERQYMSVRRLALEACCRRLRRLSLQAGGWGRVKLPLRDHALWQGAAAWLARRRSHVAQLELHVSEPKLCLGGPFSTRLGVTLGALAFGALEQLEVHAGSRPLELAGWLAFLPRLHTLTVSGQCLHFIPDLAHVGSVTKLDLRSEQEVGPSMQPKHLPRQLKVLKLSNFGPRTIPGAASGLHALMELDLGPYHWLEGEEEDEDEEEEGQLDLSCVSAASLTSLSLCCCWLRRLPQQISMLTGLRRLWLGRNSLDARALAPLLRLSCLERLVLQQSRLAPPEGIFHMPALKALNLEFNIDLWPWRPTPGSSLPSLPLPPSTPALESLTVNADIAARSLGALAALTSLTHLRLARWRHITHKTPHTESDAALAALVPLLARLPQLQCLEHTGCLASEQREEPGEQQVPRNGVVSPDPGPAADSHMLRAAVEELQRARPGLLQLA